MKREAGDYIEDIIGAMDKAMNFVKNISYEKVTEPLIRMADMA